MAYIQTEHCYKHTARESGIASPIEYQVCIDPMTGTRSGECPECRKEYLKASITANSKSALTWLELSAGFNT